ncbi:unnamed protein product [Nezara viridula]|uniref:Neuropeptide n=1 Tax=Nezara viridula TaxID=85310 RepID=A0A9P0E1T6_NEZVI|nr:unnamed protein product [Nezara viridula]
MYGIFKFFVMLVVAIVALGGAMAQDHYKHHEKAYSHQNNNLHAYHPVPLFFVMILLAAFAMAGEYEHGGHGGAGGHGHGHGHATSYQNYVLHSYHPVPVYYHKGHGHH